MPVVPSTDSPPTMPSRRVHRLFRETLAAGDRDRDGDVGRRRAVRLGEIVELLADHRARRRVDRRFADARAAGRAGSPCRRLRRRESRCRVPGAAQASSATISAPCVTSGSSPASLTMPARAPCRSPARPAPARKLGVCPPGRRIVTGSGKWPVSSAANAARAAAAAQAPVVQPRRSGAVSIAVPCSDLRATRGGISPVLSRRSAHLPHSEQVSRARTAYRSGNRSGFS